MESDSNITKNPVKTHLQEAESELKISQDKMASEKIMSFVIVGGEANGGRGGGVSITFSEAGATRCSWKRKPPDRRLLLPDASP